MTESMIFYTYYFVGIPIAIFVSSYIILKFHKDNITVLGFSLLCIVSLFPVLRELFILLMIFSVFHNRVIFKAKK